MLTSRTGRSELDDRDRRQRGLTAVVGTPFYMSPEAVGGSTQTTASDCWSLGVILFELLTLQRPFHARTFRELAVVIAAGQYQAEALRECAAIHPAPLRRLATPAEGALLHMQPTGRATPADVAAVLLSSAELRAHLVADGDVLDDVAVAAPAGTVPVHHHEMEAEGGAELLITNLAGHPGEPPIIAHAVSRRRRGGDSARREQRQPQPPREQHGRHAIHSLQGANRAHATASAHPGFKGRQAPRSGTRSGTQW